MLEPVKPSSPGPSGSPVFVVKATVKAAGKPMTGVAPCGSVQMRDWPAGAAHAWGSEAAHAGDRMASRQGSRVDEVAEAASSKRAPGGTRRPRIN